MNIILDRFTKSTVNYFIQFFSNNDYFPKIATVIAEKNLSDRRKGCLVYGDFDVASGYLCQEFQWSLGNEEIDFLSQYEGIFIKMASRFVVFPGEWKPQDISDHYFMLANFWFEQIKKHDINACVSSCIPHDPSSFSLYIVSKLCRIPYVFIDVPWAARRIRFVSCSFSRRNLMLRNGGREPPDWAMKIVKEYIDDLRFDFESATPFYMDIVNERLSGSFKIKLFSDFSKVRDVLKRIKREDNNLSYIFQYVLEKFGHMILPAAPVFFKVGRKRWQRDAYKSAQRFQWYVARAYSKLRIRGLSREYNRLIGGEGVDGLPEKFIYFPLPLEPEGSTLPSALTYGSVLMSIKRILNELPSGFALVLKISPVQFRFGINEGSTMPEWHAPGFYEELQSIHNIIFVSEKISSGDLIKRCSGLACINGTAAVEAAALGKHAIIFSPMWYDSLENIHLVKNQDDISSVMSLIESGKFFNCDAEKIEMSPDMIFDNHGLAHFGGQEKILESLGGCLIAGLQVFASLDENKWEL